METHTTQNQTHTFTQSFVIHGWFNDFDAAHLDVLCLHRFFLSYLLPANVNQDSKKSQVISD